MIRIDNLEFNENRGFRLSIPFWAVSRGETVAVLGPSGSGKTTLLKLIAGLKTPDSGDIFLDGTRVTTRPPVMPHCRNISMLSQDFGLWQNLTAVQHIAFARTRGRSMKAIPDDRALLGKVRLDFKANACPGALSGGEQQRLALARALAVKPDILLLDEPFSNIDPVLRHELSGILDHFRVSEKCTCVQVRHDISQPRSMGDRISIMQAGTIIQHDTWAAVRENPADAWTAALVKMIS